MTVLHDITCLCSLYQFVIKHLGGIIGATRIRFVATTSSGFRTGELRGIVGAFDVL